MTDVRTQVNKDFAGNLLFHYVWWILSEATKRNIKTLYFLARDGYILRKIAETFCEKYSLDIECRYLYCSRASLRMPSYYLIGDEEKDLLLYPSYKMSVKILLQRGNLTQAEYDVILPLLDLDIDDEKNLSKQEYLLIKERISNCKKFWDIVNEKSRSVYDITVRYFQQEGIFDKDVFAIVDSGWSGSMQRSFRQLLQSKGYSGKIIGFYFGMFLAPKEPVDGLYLNWYFDSKGCLSKKARFNNNLFESILSANHGMTIGYESISDRIEPMLLSFDSNNKQLINSLHCDIIEQTKELLSKLSFDDFNLTKSRRYTDYLIKRYMFRPDEKIAEYLGQLLFCDDITESYQNKLADRSQFKYLKQYLLLNRFYYRICCKKHLFVPLYWPYGTVAFAPKYKRYLYRNNIFIWQLIKYFCGRL